MNTEKCFQCTNELPVQFKEPQITCLFCGAMNEVSLVKNSEMESSNVDIRTREKKTKDNSFDSSIFSATSFLSGDSCGSSSAE